MDNQIWANDAVLPWPHAELQITSHWSSGGLKCKEIGIGSRAGTFYDLQTVARSWDSSTPTQSKTALRRRGGQQIGGGAWGGRRGGGGAGLKGLT